MLGDDGKPYPNTDEKLIAQMRRLVSMADICTPNLTELCLLTGVNPHEAVEKTDGEDLSYRIKAACAALMADGCGAVAVTGIRTENSVKNFLMTSKGVTVTESPSYHVNMSGAGDIFSSILTAKVLLGESPESAVAAADGFLTRAISDTAKNNGDAKHGVNFEKYLKDLI